MDTFLITGASKGIGKSLAFVCAKRGINLLLVARSEDLLKSLSDELTHQYNISVNYLALDLVEPNAIDKIFDFIKEQNIQLTGCLNNAGFGMWGQFANDDIEHVMKMNELNMNVLTKLSHRFIQNCKPETKSYLLNVASTASFQPTPYMGVYSATKAYVYSFTRSLHEELKPRNINVTCLCPGPTKTEFASDDDLGELAKVNNRIAMSSDKVAQSAINGLFKNEAVVIPGFSNYIGAKAASLFPESLVVSTVGRVFKMVEK